MKKQQKFKVADNETIQDCLQRMREAGYTPVKRFEKPVYKENKNGELEVLKQEIEFTGQLVEQ
ncbi:NETI motif-containing protein [Staphylococcus edaphicus]|uniref:NETI motif-containing protein n=1 Tax=Staphylococcus edaphicus TaxID=1955013 RepID=A0A2C6WP24_9STAP|nr:NETI motif-containing protein [Staphylococcus edaphicus]PHK49506.1 NETI motif-containing protein [Staphylococcus edaphicus]UQW82392.1 NETI motif-containing protein [Staphylococcus edaphicus]